MNAIKPGVLPTEWGTKFGQERFDAIINQTVLKTVTTLQVSSSILFSYVYYYVAMRKLTELELRVNLHDAGKE